MAETDVLQWYTKARKGLPILIGKGPKGESLPGGPYTLGQLVVLGAVIVVGTATMGLWGQFGGLGNIMILLAVAGSACFMWGHLPLDRVNPWTWVSGAQSAATSARQGRHRDKAVSLPPVHRVRGTVAIAYSDLENLPDPPPETPRAAPANAGPAQTTPEPTPRGRSATPTQQAWSVRKDR